MSFDFCREFFIRAGLPRVWLFLSHTLLTKLFANPLDTTSGEMIGGGNSGLALSFNGLVTGQKHLCFLDTFSDRFAFLYFSQ